MELVEATADDLDALVDRWYDLANAMEQYSEMNELAYADVDEVSVDGFRAHLDDEDVTDYLVVQEGETIGFVTLREGHHPSRQHSQYLRIVNLAIDEAHRGRGHGTEVVERVKKLARERGCDHLKVSCEWQNEDARRFYRDTNFQPKQVEYAQPLE
ncbi:Protein N-acetyltransferase, RimJ/RimL family [Halogranum amylolyticum]|uniref:Protein N-acetyltransferase, RimJ/RimL family n=1 Tax=Halogranum amylolyticum TaxID=660520 RepID=A0A1H8QKS5_9EURY|nr:GNAT family N-acetyltransferase [Halogranum amylolyticum]SEO54618.1 Protein N-acetyltransferase, RimJ/RimL family [Halogranum amylolyticum]